VVEEWEDLPAPKSPSITRVFTNSSVSINQQTTPNLKKHSLSLPGKSILIKVAIQKSFKRLIKLTTSLKMKKRERSITSTVWKASKKEEHHVVVVEIWATFSDKCLVEAVVEEENNVKEKPKACSKRWKSPLMKFTTAA